MHEACGSGARFASRGRNGSGGRWWATALGSHVLLACAVALGFSRTARAGFSPGALARSHEKLDGPTQCLACHPKGSDSIRDRCLACHEEIAWLADNGRGLHGRKNLADCGVCHAEHRGRNTALVRFEEGEPARFDHTRAGWPLVGRHAAVKCGDCHTSELQLSQAGRILRKKKRSETFLGLERECAACHRDVHGGTFGGDCHSCHEPTEWSHVPRFDHRKTSFPLTGKHAGLECAKCHRAARLHLPVDERGRTHPVLKPLAHAECSDCHADTHQGRLGPSCSRCHATESFHRVETQSFDHERTRYALRGAHLKVECSRCHEPQGNRFTKPAFLECASCHKDPHRGTAMVSGRKVDCAACHRVEGFRLPTFTVEQHQASSFPLEGRHVQVKCEACHRRLRAGGVPEAAGSQDEVVLRPPHDLCRDCHEDSHGGQLAHRPDRGECGACHRTGGWKPSTFGVSEHSRAKLPLEGRHTALACAACHGPEREHLLPVPPPEVIGRARVAFAVMGAGGCASCHPGPHGVQFAGRADGGACQSCHGAASFKPAVLFVHDRDTHFPLYRAHGRLACDRCHGGVPDASGRTVTVYRPVSTSCRECHVKNGLPEHGFKAAAAPARRGKTRATGG